MVERNRSFAFAALGEHNRYDKHVSTLLGVKRMWLVFNSDYAPRALHLQSAPLRLQ